MSRNIIYSDSRLKLINGTDHAIGMFFQIYDKKMENETPEQEGLVLDWSELFGFEINLTGMPNSENVIGIINKYITDNGDSKNKLMLIEKL
jgi:hypothetical protein